MGISTHVLDTARGVPAVGVGVSLRMQIGMDWVTVNDAMTDTDGRIRYLLPEGVAMLAEIYVARFDTGAYFAEQGLEGLYPWIEIVFSVVKGQSHYHVPLLLTAHGYTTYRGT